MSKTYRWETEREREQAVFLEAVVKTYKGWVGKLPRMNGFAVRPEVDSRAGGESRSRRRRVPQPISSRRSSSPALLLLSLQTHFQHLPTLFDDLLTTQRPPLVATEVVPTQEDLSTAARNTATLPTLQALPLSLLVPVRQSPPLGRQLPRTLDRIPFSHLAMVRQLGGRE